MRFRSHHQAWRLVYRQARSWPAAARRSMCIQALNLYSLAISGTTADHPTETISSIRIGATADRFIETIPMIRTTRLIGGRRIQPPAPRKVETPPAETVLVIGDSLAEWLAYGLELVFAETPQIGIVRKIKPDLGLVRDDARLDAPEWTQAIKDLLPASEKPNAIVVMLGVNDRAPLRDRPPATKPSATPPDSEHPPPATAAPQHPPPGASYEFHTDKWAELYSKRIDDMIAALKTRGVPIIWVGLPAVRGAKSTSDMSYLDELYRARADKAGIAYVDIWDGFVDDQGRYAQDGPDFEGQTRRLRTYDGVNFTKAGAEKLGHYVEHDLRRLLGSHVLPVALPGPEEQPPANDNVAGRPVIGPVVPLNATNAEKGGQLLGKPSN